MAQLHEWTISDIVDLISHSWVKCPLASAKSDNVDCDWEEIQAKTSADTSP